MRAELLKNDRPRAEPYDCTVDVTIRRIRKHFEPRRIRAGNHRHHSRRRLMLLRRPAGLIRPALNCKTAGVILLAVSYAPLPLSGPASS